MTFWIVQALNGLQLSMLLFLLSIGLTVIFGLMHFVNLAHGALYALGAYAAVSAVAVTGSYWGGFAFAPIAVAFAGFILYVGLIRRMRKAGPMNQVLVTFGLIFVFLDLIRITWGDLALSIPEPQLFTGRTALLGVVYPTYRLFIIGLGIAVIDQFTLAGDNWPGLVALPIVEPTDFETYIAFRRDTILSGFTYKLRWPGSEHAIYITVNDIVVDGPNGPQRRPFEVFINTSKAGSDTAAVSEAIGRLISYILRLASPIAPVDRLREVVTQLSGIGGGRSLGFGPHRVRSLPDGVGQVLDEYLRNREDEPPAHEMVAAPQKKNQAVKGGNGHHEAPATSQPLMKFGDLCPECGEAAVVNEEGCRKCYACGYSEC